MGKKFDLFLFIASDMGKNNGLAIPDERPPTQTEAAIGLLLNLLTIPGLGTVLFGSERTRRDGMSQLVLFCIGLVLSLCFIGIFLILAAWIWSLFSSIQDLANAPTDECHTTFVAEPPVYTATAYAPPVPQYTSPGYAPVSQPPGGVAQGYIPPPPYQQQ